MLGSSCYCLNLGFVVVKRSFSSGGNQEEGTDSLYSYLISSLLPKSISSHLLHCVTSLPFGSVWEWEAWRQKEEKKRKKLTRIPSKCLPLPLTFCAQRKQSELSATCLCPGGTLPLLGLCTVLGTGPSLDGHVHLCHMWCEPFYEHTSGGVSSCSSGAGTAGADSRSRGVGGV